MKRVVLAVLAAIAVAAGGSREARADFTPSLQLSDLSVGQRVSVTALLGDKKLHSSAIIVGIDSIAVLSDDKVSPDWWDQDDRGRAEAQKSNLRSNEVVVTGGSASHKGYGLSAGANRNSNYSLAMRRADAGAKFFAPYSAQERLVPVIDNTRSIYYVTLQYDDEGVDLSQVATKQYVESRVAPVETRVGGLETRVGGLETRVGGLETRTTTLEGDVSLLKKNQLRLGGGWLLTGTSSGVDYFSPIGAEFVLAKCNWRFTAGVGTSPGHKPNDEIWTAGYWRTLTHSDEWEGWHWDLGLSGFFSKKMNPEGTDRTDNQPYDQSVIGTVNLGIRHQWTYGSIGIAGGLGVAQDLRHDQDNYSTELAKSIRASLSASF